MRDDHSGALRAFHAIVRHGGFTAAARELEVTPSALSQTLKQFEKRLGVRLLQRTTRSVGLTEAGQALLARTAPALAEVDGAIEELRRHGEHPAGTLRDMVALPLGGLQRSVVVGSPDYIARHGKPKHPRDLRAHRCIRFRFRSGGPVYRWEFAEHGRWFELDVDGPLIANDLPLVVRAALDGVGLLHTMEVFVREHIATGRLVGVLEEWLPPYDGFYLYYPSRYQVPPKLRVFIDFLRERMG